MKEGQALSKEDKTCSCGNEMKPIEKDGDAVVLHCTHPDCGLIKTVYFDKR
jgi:hypothetical protein